MGYLAGADVQLDPEGVEVHENPIFELNEVSRQEHWGPQIKGHDQCNGRTKYYGQNVQRPHWNDQFGYNSRPYGHPSTGPPPLRRQEPPNYWENQFQRGNANGYTGTNQPYCREQNPPNYWENLIPNNEEFVGMGIRYRA